MILLLAVNMPDYGRNIIYGIVILVLPLLDGREESPWAPLSPGGHHRSRCLSSRTCFLFEQRRKADAIRGRKNDDAH